MAMRDFILIVHFMLGKGLIDGDEFKAFKENPAGFFNTDSQDPESDAVQSEGAGTNEHNSGDARPSLL